MRYGTVLSALLIALCLVVPPAAGGEDGLAVAMRGVVAEPLRLLREGTAGERGAGEEALLARGRFALPYVLAAAEATGDDAYRARLLLLAERIRALAPDRRSPFDLLAPARNLPGFDEYPPYDVTASNLLKDCRRERWAREVLADPTRLDAARLHVEAGRYGEALAVLGSVLSHEPGFLPEVLGIAGDYRIHRDGTAADAVAGLERRARALLERPDPVFGAREAFLLADWYRPERKERLAAVMEKYPGEDGALLAEQALLQSSDDPVRDMVARLLAFADRHPGTEAARPALDHCAWQLAGINLIDYGAEDQCLPRLRRLGDVAARLMSGEFPGGEGARAAVEHLNSFFLSSKPKTMRASAETMLAAFRTFFASHFLLDAFGEDAVLVDYSLVSKLESLHRALGASEEELPAKVDEELEALEKALPEPIAIRTLRALRRAGRDEAGATRELELIEEANGGRLHSRKALAARAGLACAAGRFTEAAELYARYFARYPGTAYSWLAALRVGHCRLLAGDSKGAEVAWAAAEKAFPDHALLAALLPLTRARAAEADGRIAEAAKDYRAALAAWPECCADGLGTPLGSLNSAPRPYLDPDASVSREAVEARLAELTRTDIAPGDLEQLLTARRFAKIGDVDSASRIFEGLLRNRAGSPVAAEATRDLVDLLLGAAVKDPDRAEVSLTRATATGDRFASFAAELLRAFLELRAEDGSEAAAKRLEAALVAWEKGQPLREPEGPLEAAVAGIRETCFRPHDGTFFRGEWKPERESPFVVLDPAVAVKLADGTETMVSLRQRFPDLPHVLYFTAREVGWIAAIMDGLGGAARSERGGVMAVPQPQGGSKAVAALLGRFIQVIPGHWGGWHLKTFPRIDEVVFGDAEMTRATVHFVVRYEGGEAKVSARDHGWALTGVRMTWIE